MSHPSICFIGGGNMARSIIGGLLADGYDADRISAADPVDAVRQGLRENFGIKVGADNAQAVIEADVVVLAVKPQLLREVTRSMSASLREKKPLIISIAAGIRSADIARWIGEALPIVRVMPNTPALIQAGASALFATAEVTQEQRDVAESLLRSVGLSLWVDKEADIDAVTAVSGSGPAYFFLVMEAMEKAAAEMGLNRESAQLLVLQTAFGAAKMALESPEDCATLRQRVTSPGGTTEQAISVLNKGGLDDLFARAMHAARARSVELAEQLGEE